MPSIFKELQPILAHMGSNPPFGILPRQHEAAIISTQGLQKPTLVDPTRQVPAHLTDTSEHQHDTCAHATCVLCVSPIPADLATVVMVYRRRAANASALLQVELPDPNHPLSRSLIGFSWLHSPCHGALETPYPRGEPRASTAPCPYGIWNCGHGGTRNRSTSLRLHTWSVKPAAIAGVRCCQRLPDLIRSIGSGSGKRMLA